MTPKNPICVALDTPDLAQARALAGTLKPYAGYLKIGLEFFYAHGRAGYEAVAEQGLPIFLDLKLHDIPNTVAGGLRALMKLRPRPAIINVHATGGRDMMMAAADAVRGDAKLIAVTILTSLSDDDLWAMGFETTRDTHVLKRGDFLKPADRVTAGVPAFLHPVAADSPPARLTFARWLADKRSPTTARAFERADGRTTQAVLRGLLLCCGVDEGTRA
jgi:orotidine-5'-phosphate decarboxylase